ncbi:MAG: bifunctional oligoribonuclease/PAP phosphatase NrnA [Planctomycetia bacterium]|nr:bifunctional oligoribonuclease/PAP phosphatase NrnA [Planctomycetia bacterium]
MPLDWTPFIDFVRAPQRFVISTHMRPDGDALGSALGLAHALRHLGKQAQVVIPSPLPPRYVNIIAEGDVVMYDPAQEALLAGTEAIIIVDTGTWNQLGKFGDWMRRQNVPKFVIDHHRTQDDLNATRLVDISAEACGRLIYDAARALNVPLNKDIASYLFMAVATDTGWFHHRNVLAETFSLAAVLTQAGAEPTQLYQLLYDTNSLARQKLSGHVLHSLDISHGGDVCYASITLADYLRTGAVPLDSEDLVNLTLTVSGVDVGILFLEQPVGGTKVSLRSRGKLDCSKLAEKLGGGGHSAAAGAIVQKPLPEVRTLVLDEVNQRLDGLG